MKRLCLILAFALCIALLGGCGFGGGSGNSAYRPEPVWGDEEITEVPVSEQTTSAPVEEMPVETAPATTEEISGQTEPATTEETVGQTEPVTAETTTPAQTDDLSSQITQIREWYGEITNSTDLDVTYLGTSAAVYHKDGQIVAITEYRQLNTDDDPAMETVHFYYHNGTPFFVFIEYYKAQYDEVRLYFADGELIRWILDDNAPNDYTPNTQWQAYYTDAVNAYISAS